MPRKCALGCPYSSAILHCFPNPKKDPGRFKVWCSIAGLSVSDQVYAKKRVCDNHFTQRDRNRNHRLNVSAVPSLFLPGMQKPLHVFPNPAKERQRFNSWMHSIRGDIIDMDSDSIYKYRRVCHVHFEDKFHCCNSRLSRDAMPTLNLPGNPKTPTDQNQKAKLHVQSGQNPVVQLSKVPTTTAPGQAPTDTSSNPGQSPAVQLSRVPTTTAPGQPSTDTSSNSGNNLVMLLSKLPITTAPGTPPTDTSSIPGKKLLVQLSRVPTTTAPGQPSTDTSSKSAKKVLVQSVVESTITTSTRSSNQFPANRDPSNPVKKVIVHFVKPSSACRSVASKNTANEVLNKIISLESVKNVEKEPSSASSKTIEKSSNAHTPDDVDPLELTVSEEFEEPIYECCSPTSDTFEETRDETLPTLDPLKPVFQCSKTAKGRMKTDLCQICLRPDKKLVVVDSTLSEFHTELCDYYMVTVDSLASNSRCCLECVYLLRKLYNFKMKCKKADKLFKKWMKKADWQEKMPPEFLHTLLPPSPLGQWRPENIKIYKCKHAEMGPMSYVDDVTKGRDSTIHFDLIDNKTTKEDTKVEKCDCDDTELESINSSNTEDIYDVISLDENSNDYNESEDDSVSYEDEMFEYLEDSVSDKNNIQNECAIENNTSVVIDNCDVEDNEDTSPPKKKLRLVIPEERADQQPGRKSLIELANISLTDNDYIDPNNLKTQENNTETIKINNDDSKSVRENNDHQDFNKYKRSFASTVITPVKDTTKNTDMEIESNESLANYEHNTVQYSSNARKLFTNKDIIATLTNISLGDAVNLDKDAKEEIVNLLKSVSVARYVPLIKVDTNTNRDIINKLNDVVLAGEVPLVNLVTKSSENVAKNRNIEARKRERVKLRKLPYTKERLLTELKCKFEKWGVLKTRDGITINRQLILQSVENKAPDKLLRQLWKAIHGKTVVKAIALKIFKAMQKKYRNDHKYETVFEMEYLNTYDKMMQEFEKRKTYECFLNAEYKCEQCRLPFKYEKLLEYHRKCTHDTDVGVTGSVCGVRHGSKEYMSAAHEAVYRCRLCPLVTYYRRSMMNHYHQHRGKQYKCSICAVTYKSQSVYLTHMGKYHRRGQHICTMCGRAFISELGLKNHRSKMHKECTPTESEVRCEDCKLNFPTLEVYLIHVQNSHIERTFRSSKAGTQKEVPRERKKEKIRKPRMRKPTKKITMVCRVCDAKGGSIGWLTHHFAMDHPSLDISVVYADKKKHLCHICGKGYAQQTSLSSHLDKHFLAPQFPCPVCPKRFYSSLARSEHRFRHLPPGFDCSYCGKKFRTKANLYCHVRIHIGDRRFKCSICGKGFLHRASLNEHVRGVHGHVRRVKKKGIVETAVCDTLSSESSDSTT